MTVTQAPPPAEYALPHDDVVLYAIVHVANINGIHPWSIGQGVVRRPAPMSWISGHTESMRYSNMRIFVMKLVNQFGVAFDANGFSVGGGPYMHVRGMKPPAIKANPSAL